MLRILMTLIVCGVLASLVPAQEPELPLPAEPKQGRPFLMPPAERQRIQTLVAREPWAKQEYERLTKQASGGDGHAAAFLYALERDAKYIPAATKYLLSHFGPESFWVKSYRKAMADPDHFKGGQADLAGVYYNIGAEQIIAFDWVYDGLSAEDRKTILEGLLIQARYRIRAMDRWTQTANLVFKPTFVVALTGLVTRDPQCLEWGFRRTKPWGAHIGGYFAALNHMLYDGGAWHEAPIYPIAHLDLVLSAQMSRYLGLADGQDWFQSKLPGGGSPRGLMDYFLDTAYPIERIGDTRRVRVASYGDGATNGSGDLFLIHAGPTERKRNILAHDGLAASYAVSGDPRYAAFLALLSDYKPNLWDRRPLPAKPVPLPPAPSKVWPRFGLAMLRSDESPTYWTSGDAIAVFQLMSQGYGHDHRDKFSLTLHGAGRLFYPDYNAIQYENMAIGWSRNSVSHNTLLVDEQDTRNAEPTGLRHDFNPDVKFLATAASGVFESVDQTRALLLTREYLLDVFHATSPIPHTYDYLLHSFGEAEPARPGAFLPSDAMKRRFWLIDNQRTAKESDAWSVDFVLKDEPAARLRLHVAAEPNTQVTLGQWGDELAKQVAKAGNTLDRLTMLAARRSGVRQTAFIATHEPTRAGQSPRITRVTKLAQNPNGALVRIDAADFTDYAAVRFGADQAASKPLHFVLPSGQFASITNYGYLRLTKAGDVIGRGDWRGFRLPLASDRLTLNGKKAKTTREGGDLVFGEPAPADVAKHLEPAECPFPTRITPSGPLRMFARDRREVTLEIKNTLKKPLSGHVAFSTPPGVAVEPVKLEFKSVAPGATARLPLQVTLGEAASGKQTLTYRVFWTTADSPPTRSADQSLVVFAGPTLLSEYANRQGNYVLYSPKFTARFDLFHGLCRYLADEDGTVRLDGAPLFTLSDGKTSLLDEQTKHAFTWAREAPADLVAHAYDKCRWQALFYGGRMAIRMDRGWTQFDRAQFEIPGRWKSPGGPPRWKRIVGVDEKGKESDVQPGTKLKVAAAELEFPGGKWNLAFQFQPPQPVTFDGAGMKFSIGSLNNDQWHMGFVLPDEFDKWRGKEKPGAKGGKQPVEIHVPADADGRAIQSAIDKAAEAGGGAVHLAAGRYPVAASIHLRNHVRLVGQPGKTVLAMTAAKSRALLAKDGKRFVRQITLGDSSGYQVGDGLLIFDKKNANGFMVTTATLTKDLGSGTFALDTYLRFDYDVNRGATVRSAFPIITGWEVSDVAVEGVTVEGNWKQDRTEFIDGCKGGGIYFHECRNVLVRGCTVRHYNGDGISFQWNSENVTVEDCTVEDNSGMGIHPGSDSHDSLVRKNVVQRNGNSGLFVCVAVKRCRFEDNQLLKNAGNGISIGTRDTDNTFFGNRIVANAGAGIEFRDEPAETGAHRNRFERNAVLDNGPRNGKNETDQAAVVIRGHHHDLVFRQNTIGSDKPTDKPYVGILVSREATGFQAAENQFRNVKTGVVQMPAKR
jgi:parallel beta-helix repeat protein